MNVYEKIEAICIKELQDNPFDPELFNRITHEMVAAGVQINQAETVIARALSPNLIAVFDTGKGVQDFIEVIGQEIEFSAYYPGIHPACLIPENKVYLHYDDPGALESRLDEPAVHRKGRGKALSR